MRAAAQVTNGPGVALGQFESVDIGPPIDSDESGASLETAPTKRRKIQRPMTAYLHFCEDFRPRCGETGMIEQSKACGLAWRALGAEQRTRFADLAAQDKATHAMAMQKAAQEVSDAAPAPGSDDSTGDSTGATSTHSKPGPRTMLTPGANGRRLYRGTDRARPRTGLKVAHGARGGGGSGKRINTDLSHDGRKSRVSVAMAKEIAAMSRSRGKPLQEKAFSEACDMVSTHRQPIATF